MSEKKKNLSEFSKHFFASANNYKIAILVSEWNEEITSALKVGALNALTEHGVERKNVYVYSVPGSFELSSGAAIVLDVNNELDAVICLGCIIQGETRHFDFIAQAVSAGITKVGIEYGVPVIFGVLTCNNYQQALDRSGGMYGNKGVEAAVSALKMLEFRDKCRN